MSNIIKKQLKKSGLIILDAHLHPLDILLTAKYFRKNLHANVTMPIAGYVFYIPLLKQVVAWFKKAYQINFLPVYRKEELEPKNLGLKFWCSFYPKELDLETRKKANRKFVQTAMELSEKPGELVIAAPYGSTVSLFGKNVRNGIKKILLNNSYHLTSITRWHFHKMNFKTYSGKISSFKSSLDQKKIEGKIQKEFACLPLPIWLNLLKISFFGSKILAKVPIFKS